MIKAKPILLYLFLTAIYFSCNDQAQPDEETSQEPRVDSSGGVNSADNVIRDTLTISTPAENARVNHREIVRGKVLDPTAKVWVIVRPMATADFYVQPPVDVNNDGTWGVQVYIGESPGSNTNERFKILAIANPKQQLKGSEKLNTWPEAQWRSRLIEVVKE
jgi:hypothetical protein